MELYPEVLATHHQLRQAKVTMVELVQELREHLRLVVAEAVLVPLEEILITPLHFQEETVEMEQLQLYQVHQ
jgi:hypothetical protein